MFIAHLTRSRFLKLLGRILISILLLIFLVVLCRSFLCTPVESLFKVSATSEYLSLFTPDINNPRHILYNAEVYSDGDLIDSTFNGSISFEDSISINFRKAAYRPLYIEYTSQKKNKQLCHLHFAKSDSTLLIKDQVDVKIKSSSKFLMTHKFPLQGIVTIGKTIDYPVFGTTNSILYKGQITTQVQTSSRGSYKEVDTKDLSLGDAITFLNEEDQSTKPGVGLVAINSEGLLNINYRIKAKEAIILKQGPKSERDTGYVVFSTSFDRIINNNTIKNLSVVLGGLIALITIITFVYDTKFFLERD